MIGTHDWHSVVPLMLPVFVFFVVLEIRAHRDRNQQWAQVRTDNACTHCRRQAASNRIPPASDLNDFLVMDLTSNRYFHGGRSPGVPSVHVRTVCCRVSLQSSYRVNLDETCGFFPL